MDLDTDLDPDSAIFITDLQDTNKKHLHNFSKIKNQKEVTKQ
jgi:hypothetical protein